MPGRTSMLYGGTPSVLAAKVVGPANSAVKQHLELTVGNTVEESGV